MNNKNNNKITYEQQQQQSGYELLKIEQEIYVDWSSCCCCCCSCVILLLLIGNCGGTLTYEQQQQNYIWTTTTTTSKWSIYIHFLFNLQECNWGGWLQLKASTLYVIMLVRCNPQWRHLVTKSSTTSGQLDIYSQMCPAQIYPPSRGIWWWRMVLMYIQLNWAKNGISVDRTDLRK